MVGDVEDKIMSLFKTNTAKDYSKPTHVNHVYEGGKKPRKPKIKKQSEDNITKNVRIFLKQKSKMKQSKTQ